MTEREAFEAWALSAGWPHGAVNANRSNYYSSQSWEAWQAARAVEQAVLAKRVPMTDAQIDESMRAKFYPARNRAFIDGVEAAERHHGIVGKEGGNVLE